MRTRFAPSPTGHLHLGHVLHALYLWSYAKARGASIDYRLEDHDRIRSKQSYADAIEDEISWLGFEADRIVAKQSERVSRYESVFQELLSKELVYPCVCTRKEVVSRIGLRLDNIGYDGHCFSNKPNLVPDKPHCWRVRCDKAEISFDDILAGRTSTVVDPGENDFVVRDKDNNFSYMFACVCDDIEDGIDLVIRGRDLAHTTASQIFLSNLIEKRAAPLYCHHPLILGKDGNKLSKRDRASSISDMRAKGAEPAGVIEEALACLKLESLEIPQEVQDYLNCL